MFKLSPNHNINYCASVKALTNFRKLENSDRLFVTTIEGNDIITASQFEIGDLVIYFPVECTISSKFLAFTNSYENKEMNDNPEVKGYFNKAGRVRAVKMRGSVSTGFIVPVQSFYDWLVTLKPNLKLSEFVANTEFDYYDDVFVCKKYVPIQQVVKERNEKQKQERKHKVARKPRLVDNQFRFHHDTPQLAKNLHKVLPTDIITITGKLHGTSGVFSQVLVNKALSRWQRFLKWCGADIVDKEYGSVFSSRKIVKAEKFLNPEEKKELGYYKEDIWKTVNTELEPFLEEGMTLYCEIVGYLKSGSMIQSNYDYGYEVGKHGTYVYRITTTTPSGKVIEWSSLQIKEWCNKKGINMVPIYYTGQAQELFPNLKGYLSNTESTEEELNVWRDEFFKALADKYLEKDCQLCVSSKKKVPDEGVCLRIEGLESNILKAKSRRFLKMETDLLDTDAVDIESEESIEDETT